MRSRAFAYRVAVPASVVISTLVALAIGEVIARRALGRHPLEANRSAGASPTSVTSYFWVPDEHLGFANRANGDFVNTNVLEQPEVRTDAWGHRRGLGPTEGAPVVLVAGDSIVFAAEVEDDETPSSEIWRLLVRRDAVEVRNIGVRGYNTVQAAGRSNASSIAPRTYGSSCCSSAATIWSRT